MVYISEFGRLQREYTAAVLLPVKANVARHILTLAKSRSEVDILELNAIKISFLLSSLNDYFMLLIWTYKKRSTERIISVLRSVLCDCIHSYVIAHVASRLEF